MRSLPVAWCHFRLYHSNPYVAFEVCAMFRPYGTISLSFISIFCLYIRVTLLRVMWRHFRLSDVTFGTPYTFPGCHPNYLQGLVPIRPTVWTAEPWHWKECNIALYMTFWPWTTWQKTLEFLSWTAADGTFHNMTVFVQNSKKYFFALLSAFLV